MPVNRSPTSKEGEKTPSTSVSAKRAADDLFKDALSPSEEQLPKKPNTGDINDPSGIMPPKKPSLNNNNRPTGLNLSIINNNNNPNKDKVFTQNEFEFNVPVNNRFNALNNVNDSASANTADASKESAIKSKKVKIPPITIVSSTNFDSVCKYLNENASNCFSIKYMSIGLKIMTKSVEIYKSLKKKLTDDEIEFFSHDLNPDRYDTFVLSGIAKMDVEAIRSELTNQACQPLEVREIASSKKRFDNEGIYTVSFKHGSANLKKLSNIRIMHTIPKWRDYRKKQDDVTQCRRCQRFGHGMRNCLAKIKCSQCGLPHFIADCQSNAIKCANCNGDHLSTDKTCPKRKEFLEMRIKLSSNNNKTKANLKLAPIDNNVNFPKLQIRNRKMSTSSHGPPQLESPLILPDLPAKPPNHQSKWPFQNRLTFNKVLKIPDPVPKDNRNELFTSEEIKIVLSAVFQGLEKCRTKAEQLEVMFEIASKYIYGP